MMNSNELTFIGGKHVVGSINAEGRLLYAGNLALVRRLAVVVAYALKLKHTNGKGLVKLANVTTAFECIDVKKRVLVEKMFVLENNVNEASRQVLIQRIVEANFHGLAALHKVPANGNEKGRIDLSVVAISNEVATKDNATERDTGGYQFHMRIRAANVVYGKLTISMISRTVESRRQQLCATQTTPV